MIKKIIIATFCVLYATKNIYSMMEMAIMMGAQQGASIANQAVSESFQNMAQSLQHQQSYLSNNLNLFVNRAQQAEQKNAAIFEKIFSSALKKISAESSSISAYTNAMQNYIFKAVSIQKQPLYYLISPQSVAIQLEQGFAQSTMYTPSGQNWKNIFQFGDWEYDVMTDSFFQFKNSPMFLTDNSKSEQSSRNAIYNSIFTEYYTYANSYKIECDITIYQIQYPFFVGLQFNKARWISGNADSLSCSRLIGIYGASNTNIGVYFAEQPPLILYNNQTNNEPIITLNPLEQIIQNKVKQQIRLSSDLFTKLTEEPITFTIKLITSPQKIVYKLWQKNTVEPKKFITIKNGSPNVYLYHGIGFVSPGAIAQFKINKPIDILFSQNAKTNFAQELKTLFTQS